MGLFFFPHCGALRLSGAAPTTAPLLPSLLTSTHQQVLLALSPKPSPDLTMSCSLVLKTLVQATVTTHLDRNSRLPTGFPASVLMTSPSSSGLQTTAQMIFSKHKSDQSTLLLETLQCLLMAFRRTEKNPEDLTTPGQAPQDLTPTPLFSIGSCHALRRSPSPQKC